jgi:hypothetical protein
MILKELIGKIGFDVDKEKLDGVEKQLEGIKRLMEAFGAAEVVKGIAEMAEKFGEMAEKIHLSAAAAGITTTAFQQLAFSAQQSGVSQDELGSATARLSKSLFNAKMGSVEAQRAFMRFGITQEQIMGMKNGEQAMKALADGVKRTGGGFEALGPMMELTGRGSRNMMEWLQKGSGAMAEQEKRAKQIGAVLGEENVEALVEVTHAMGAFVQVLKTIGATIASYFAPSIKTAIDEFIKFYAVNRQIIQLEIKRWVWDITYALGFLWGAVKFVAQGFLNFAKNHETLVRRGGELLAVISALVPVVFVLSAAIGVLTSPITLVAAAIGLLIAAMSDLWTLLSGGSIKDTWLGQLAGSIMEMGLLGRGVSAVRSFFGGSSAAGAANSLQSAGSLSATTAGNVPTSGGGAVESARGPSNIHAPVTINVPPGSDPKMVGEKVREGVRDHLDRVHREASRSLRSSMAY